ncbi:hypothetical protein LTR39_002318 [Cryomyces antarcticus]|nr:hypothetical protein LTR39_002318 [Cryomyces antarcticus]
MPNTTAEAQERIIEIEDFDAATVRRLLSYIYTSQYDCAYTNACTNDIDHTLGDKHKPAFEAVAQVDETLERTAKTRKFSHVEERYTDENAALLIHIKVHAIADYYDVPELRALAKESFNNTIAGPFQAKGFADVAAEVYKSTPDYEKDLRGVILKATVEHIDELVDDIDFMSSIAGNSDLGDYAADFIRLVVRRHKEKFDDVLAERLEEQRLMRLQHDEELQDLRHRHNCQTLELEEVTDCLKVSETFAPIRVDRNTDETTSKANGLAACRQCHAKPNLALHKKYTGGLPQKVAFRCKTCKTEYP